MPYACTSYTPQLLHAFAFAIIYLFMIGNGGNMESKVKCNHVIILLKEWGQHIKTFIHEFALVQVLINVTEIYNQPLFTLSIGHYLQGAAH